eukprot:XP_027303527.1 rho GTPase-activating protein 28-like isoform X2 [Anas platyrhynchos]
MDSTSMEDFWCEVESIKESSEDGPEEATLLEFKPADEGELEAEWLQDVGLSTLISGAEEEDGQALLSTLTRTQAAAVQKRYNTYTQTLRKKNKHTVRDVRDIFGTNDSSKYAVLQGTCLNVKHRCTNTAAEPTNTSLQQTTKQMVFLTACKVPNSLGHFN